MNDRHLSKQEIGELVKRAIEARKKSYSPYSHYQVGAALLCEDGKIVTGCNIENAAYGPSVCAERTAFFKAVSEGARGFRAIAVVGSPEGEELTQYAYPCGVCRQVMREFCEPEHFQVIVAKSEEDCQVMTLMSLLPESFGPENVRRQ
ncbi:MAG: cytidine deaminase [Bacteroidales bacterium]|nr:cytidine deaminase [Bacteroidales bacterium]MCM1416698.1 cytidine deaminase [bacterium]MCM1423993.1 cytidine deaminase [bacterium]